MFKTIRTYELDFAVNEELTFEGIANLVVNNCTGNMMYEIIGCGLNSGKHYDLRDAKKAIKRMAA